MMTKTETDT